MKRINSVSAINEYKHLQSASVSSVFESAEPIVEEAASTSSPSSSTSVTCEAAQLPLPIHELKPEEIGASYSHSPSSVEGLSVMQAVGGRGSIQHACLGVDGCEEESAADVLNAAPTTDRRSGSPCQKMTTTPVEGTRQTGNPLGEAMREGALAATDATLTTEGEGDKSSSRALVADSSGRVKRSCVRIALNDATPIAPPEKPSPEKPWTPQTCLELADYYRGETLPESTHEDSAYQRAIRAAISLVNKQRATYSQVDAVFRYMCGRDEALKDLWWADKRVDLWHVAEHCSAKLREIERKSNSPPSVSSQPSERPSVLLSEEKRQRNLERLRALAAARTPLYGTA